MWTSLTSSQSDTRASATPGRTRSLDGLLRGDAIDIDTSRQIDSRSEPDRRLISQHDAVTLVTPPRPVE
jgi:hypothetical protein